MNPCPHFLEGFPQLSHCQPQNGLPAWAKAVESQALPSGAVERCLISHLAMAMHFAYLSYPVQWILVALMKLR